MSEGVFTFTARDGVPLRLTLRTAGHRAVVLVTPGILMHRESREHRLLAERLLEAADVATLDVRGHGDSGGLFSFGSKEPFDLAELAAWLRRDYERVGGLGFSFGGYHTCVAAALERCFDAVALVGTPHRLFILDHNFATRGLLRSLGPMLRRRRRLTRLLPSPFARRFVPSRLVHQVAPAPLLVAHGSDDWLIPPKHGRILYERALDPKRLVVIPRGLHAENMLADRPEPLLEALLGFFRETLYARYNHTMSDDAPKSAFELAMERLRRQDREAGIEERRLSEEQRAAIADVRKVYDAKLAEREILHHSERRKAKDYEELEKLEEQYRQDRERISAERDRKIEQIRLGRA